VNPPRLPGPLINPGEPP